MNEKRRIAELDIVKGIAIIYVLMRHLCELTGVNVYWPAFYNLFDSYTEGVMFLFVLLSGYVFKSKGSVLVDIKNKCRQLLFPYLEYITFFTVTYFIRYVLFSDMDIKLFLRNTISNYLAYPNLDIPALGTGYNVMSYAFVPYWYVAEIFMAFILFIFIHKIIEKKDIFVKIVTTLILMGISALLMYLDVRDLLANTFSSKASYFTVVMNIVGFAAVLMLGTILRNYNIFDIEAHSKYFAGILFIVCLIQLSVRIALYDNQYALQYGRWGGDGILSVRITTVTGFTLAYCMIYVAHYLKEVHFLKTVLSYVGTRTLDILMLHFGIGELWCMILGFWCPVYHIEKYPIESFAWWHLPVVIVLTCACLGIFFILKDKWKNRKSQ